MLEGQTALVTGASRGIGEAIAAVEAFPLSAPTIFAVGDALAVRKINALAATGT